MARRTGELRAKGADGVCEPRTTRATMETLAVPSELEPATSRETFSAQRTKELDVKVSLMYCH